MNVGTKMAHVFTQRRETHLEGVHVRVDAEAQDSTESVRLHEKKGKRSALLPQVRFRDNLQ